MYTSRCLHCAETLMSFLVISSLFLKRSECSILCMWYNVWLLLVFWLPGLTHVFVIPNYSCFSSYFFCCLIRESSRLFTNMPKTSTQMTLTTKHLKTVIIFLWGGRLVHNQFIHAAIHLPCCNLSSCCPSGAVSSSRPHYQRYQWCVLRRFLLHLLPEVYSHYWGLLLPQKLRVVITSLRITFHEYIL